MCLLGGGSVTRCSRFTSCRASLSLPQGIEVLHLYTGRPLCQFGPLHPTHIYDDVNGDTSVDTIHADIHLPPPRRSKLVTAPQAPACVGTIDSGSLGMAHENLWNGSICVHRVFVVTAHNEHNACTHTRHAPTHNPPPPRTRV